MTDLSIDINGIKFKNPLILASGFIGVSYSAYSYAVKCGAGGVTIKSIGNQERVGHPNPMTLSWGGGIINCVGLYNPGIDYCLPVLSSMLKKSKAPLIISFFADTLENFGKVAEKLVSVQPKILELNISCPNTEDDLGRPFALSCKDSAFLTKKIRQVVGKKIKIWVKLSPNVTDIADIAQSVEQAGADAIVCANTVNGMLIDVHARRPTLSNKVGGLSGPAIYPHALRNVFVVYKKVKIPVIGVGGVTAGRDVLAMIMAGASAVGVGSAIYYRGFDVFKKITSEMKTIMKEESIKNLAEIKGAAHG